MRYEWEEELFPARYLPNDQVEWQGQWHLKKSFYEDPIGRERNYKITVAWVTKIGDRKWDCQFVNHNGSRTFRSLKAAKAYAVAIITLEQ